VKGPLNTFVCTASVKDQRISQRISDTYDESTASVKSQTDTDGVRAGVMVNDFSGRSKNSTSMISTTGNAHSDNSRNTNNEELCDDFHYTDMKNNESVGNLHMKPHM
jgi:hypothetical protein